MLSSTTHLSAQFDLQTKLFKNVTEGISDADAQTPMNTNTNHIAWLTGHTVSTRYMLAKVLGNDAEEPYPEFYENGRGIDPSAKYPSMQELLKDWDSVSEKISASLKSLTEDAWNKKMPRAVPLGDTLGDFIAFIIHHEAYHLGQIGIARRFFGLEAMKYS